MPIRVRGPVSSSAQSARPAPQNAPAPEPTLARSVIADGMAPLLHPQLTPQGWQAKVSRIEARPGTWAVRASSELQALSLSGADAQEIHWRAVDLLAAVWTLGALDPDLSSAQRSLESPLDVHEWGHLALGVSHLAVGGLWTGPDTGGALQTLGLADEPGAPSALGRQWLRRWSADEGRALGSALMLRWGAPPENVVGQPGDAGGLAWTAAPALWPNTSWRHGTGQGLDLTPDLRALAWLLERAGTAWNQARWWEMAQAHLQTMARCGTAAWAVHAWLEGLATVVMNPRVAVTRRLMSEVESGLVARGVVRPGELRAERLHPHAALRQNLREHSLGWRLNRPGPWAAASELGAPKPLRSQVLGQ